MKRIVNEESTSLLEKLLGEKVTFFCMNYIYTGTMLAIDDKCVQLSDPAIVYETGSFSDKEWKDAQKLPDVICVMLSSVESFGVVK